MTQTNHEEHQVKTTKRYNERYNMKLEQEPLEATPADEENNSRSMNINQHASPDKDAVPSRKRPMSLSKKGENEGPVDYNKLQNSNERTSSENNRNESGLYVCPLCDQVLSTSHDFTVHIRQHNPNDHSHTCRLCGKTLSSASSLDRHMLVHSGERPFKCKLCNMAFTTNGNMHRHMRTHGEEADKQHRAEGKAKGKRKSDDRMTPAGLSPKKKDSILPEDKFKCPVCDKELSNKKHFEGHMETHPNDAIWCRDCQSFLPNYPAFRDHQCAKHFYGDSSVGFQDISFVDFTSDKFSHIAKSICENNSRRPSSAFHAFECEKCGKSFPCNSSLGLHMLNHSEPRGSQCLTCNCDFLTPAGLQAHQVKHRMPEHCSLPLEGKDRGSANDPEDIPEGNKEDFLAMLQLKNRDVPETTKIKIKREKLREPHFENISYYVHGKAEPQGPNPSARDAESSDFADIQSIISVTSKAPLVTSIRASPIVATPASPLMVTSSACVSPESPLVADSANASPETPSKDDSEHSSLKGSEDADTDGGAIVEGIYTCKLCNISFKKVSALKRHNRSHSQSCSSYSCSLCPYNSLDKSTLIRHLRTHNGERPFQCVICKYAFTTKANCERHVRKRHKKLNKNEIRCAMQYNPNMGDVSSSELLPPEMNGSETVCKYCSFDFKSNRVLRHHLRSLHNSCRSKPFYCTLCKLGFSTKNNCIRHVGKQHPDMKEKLADIVVSNGQLDELSDQDSIAFSDDNPSSRWEICNQSDNSQKWKDTTETSVDYSVLPETMDYSMTAERNETREEPPPKVQAVPSSAPVPLTVSDEPLNLSVRPISFSMRKNGTTDSNGIDDMVSAANSLVSLSEILPPQDEPLDLAVRALDLTLKAQSRVIAQALAVRDPKPINMQTLKPFQTVAPFYPRATPSPHPPLRAAFRPRMISPVPIVNQALALCGPSTRAPSPRPPSVSSPTKPFQEVAATNYSSSSNLNKDNAFGSFKMVNDRLSPRNQRSFSCMYCAAGFTLKSNMERHIKRKHPEFARPTRSRNFIPTLSPTMSKNNLQTLSNKTRNALRVVLNSKAGLPKEDSSQGATESQTEREEKSQDESQQSESSSVDTSSITINETALGTADNDVQEPSYEEGDLVIECNSKDGKENDEQATDLASVSSVIDTANSQQIQKYLMNTDNGDCKSDEDEDMMDDDDDLRDKESGNDGHTENSDQHSSPSSTSKKRSSYMDSPNSVACPFCNRKFPWTSSLRRHILTHTGQKPYKCPRCPIWFTTKSNCERHLVRKHGQNSEILTRTVPERPYKCNVCPSSTFSTQGNLRKHYYLKHLTKTGSGGTLHKSFHPDGDTQDEDLMDEHDCGSDSQEGGTNEEGFLSPEKQPRENSLSAQQNDIPYKCHLCEESFTVRKDCLAHIESLHNEEYKRLSTNGSTPSKTQEATKAEPDKNSQPVNENNEAETPDDRKVSCAFCFRKFWSTEDLRRHMRSHTGEKPFACDICGRTFSLKHSMIRHRRKHSGKSLETAQESSDEESPPPPKVDLSLPKPKKQIQNSLLYLMENAKPSWSKTEAGSDVSKRRTGKEDETDLIQNLLGIQDSKIIDEMLDSADSAARLLGVKKV